MSDVIKDSNEVLDQAESPSRQNPFLGHVHFYRVIEVQEIPYAGTEIRKPYTIIVEDRLGNKAFDNRPA